MRTSTINDNTKAIKTSSFNSIFQKINHKPLIISSIFSFIKDKPYRFMLLIEKDEMLKNSLNSLFYNIKKTNLLSKELNENIKLIKDFTQILLNIRTVPYFNSNYFENFVMNNKIEPSFIIYKSLCYLNKIKEENTDKSNISSISDIVFNEQKKEKTIKMVYLPYKNNEYKDSDYFCNNINKIKEIDELYCIIDDNEYYLDKDLPKINKDIIINDIYFIYIKGIKNINIYNAIKKYLILLKNNSYKKISLSSTLFIIDENKKIIIKDFDQIPIVKMINYALINKKQLTNLIPIGTPVKLQWFNFDNIGTRLKTILGLFYIFENQKIEEFVVLNANTNTFINKEKIDIYKDIKTIDNIKGKALILKFDNFYNVDLTKIKFIIEEININDVVIYISENNDIKKNIEKANNKLNLNYKKNILFYSEIPEQKRKIIPHYSYSGDSDYGYDYLEITDIYNNILISMKIYPFHFKRKSIYNLLFLIEKYYKICCKLYLNNTIIFKAYFSENKVDIIQNNLNFDIQSFINYINTNFSMNISEIVHNSNFDKKIKKNKGKKNGNKGLSNKISSKLNLENELNEEDEDFYSSEDENGDYSEDSL